MKCSDFTVPKFDPYMITGEIKKRIGKGNEKTAQALQKWAAGLTRHTIATKGKSVCVIAANNVRARSLGIFSEKYAVPYAYRVSARNFGCEGSLRSVPLYAVFCIAG